MATEQTYVLDGPTEFFFPFPVRTSGEIIVSLIPGGVLPSSEYTVIGTSATANGVTVRYPNAPRDGQSELNIARRTEANRVSTFLDDLSITATGLNAEFDNILQIVQDGVLNEYKGEWDTGELYLVLDVVTGPDGNIYISRQQHQADDFSTDLSEGKWDLYADFNTGQQAIDAALDDAEAARDKAEQWAAEPEDSEVESGRFSALHYSIKAEDSADIAGPVAGIVSEIQDVSQSTNEIDIVASDLAGGGFDHDLGTITQPTTGTIGTPDGYIISVFNIRDEIVTVDGISSDVTTVATNVADINTAANNIVDIQNAPQAAADAQQAESNAQTAANQAETALDDFTDLYLGDKTSDPVTDNDGDPLQVGALYYNTNQAQLLIYDGTEWQVAAFSADAAVVSFNGRSGAVTLQSSDVTGALGYTPQDEADDTLDDQPGSYYLDRANHTGTQTLASISDAGALASLNEVDTAQIANQAVTDDKLAQSLDLGSI